MRTIAWQCQTLVGVSLLVALTANSSLVQSAHAQFSLPPSQGTPKGTAGGGSRPTQQLCLQNPKSQDSLMALAPTQFVGLTPHSTPTIWVYVPPTIAKTLEFSLFTKEREGIYQANLPIKASGLVKITLPPQATLASDKPYQWTAALICSPTRRTEDWVVGGWIQHQPLTADLQRQLTQATAEQQVRLYTQTGFWYEALNRYLKLQQAQPQNSNLTTIWSELLKSGGLTAVPPLQKPPQMTKLSFVTQVMD
ncbi:MAG: DUF928 domain-containing protein [Oscillatoriales cyanobacterium C42_A2020_001]|nr:DUF928 domain-containing protein [Leptolyngbyaceae cyanobacterium C42_A2020_001]